MHRTCGPRADGGVSFITTPRKIEERVIPLEEVWQRVNCYQMPYPGASFSLSTLIALFPESTPLFATAAKMIRAKGDPEENCRLDTPLYQEITMEMNGEKTWINCCFFWSFYL
ncbi:MAG: hypothetical protein FJZ58_02630 [Chlamydiae bacterium]|nr:hypothetical protein [Chlamydiota bacterium]